MCVLARVFVLFAQTNCFTGPGSDGPALPSARLRGAQATLHHAGEVLSEVCVCVYVCDFVVRAKKDSVGGHVVRSEHEPGG